MYIHCMILNLNQKALKVNKSLLNNLLGRFGLNIIKPVSKIVDQNKLDSLLSTRKIKYIKSINENTYLVNYNPFALG